MNKQNLELNNLPEANVDFIEDYDLLKCLLLFPGSTSNDLMKRLNKTYNEVKQALDKLYFGGFIKSFVLYPNLIYSLSSTGKQLFNSFNAQRKAKSED